MRFKKSKPSADQDDWNVTMRYIRLENCRLEFLRITGLREIPGILNI
jgi:hypothetical protein